MNNVNLEPEHLNVAESTEIGQEVLADVPLDIAPTKKNFIEIQNQVILDFGQFFENDGGPHFRIALKNMEIAKLNSDAAEKNKMIQTLIGNEKTI